MSDILDLTAAALGKKIGDREISSVEATTAYIDRIEKLNGSINAYVTVEKEEALKRAKEIDEKIAAGELKSPLAGVPVAVKDNMCIKGSC